MADNTSIPIIVQGNSFSLAIPLQIYVIDDNEMVLEDYTPDPTDEVTIQLKGSRRNYTYTPTIEGNIANIDLGGYELADNYAVVVTIVKQDGKRLRSFRTDQFFIVESSDDLTQDDIIAGLEENVIYLNAQAFIAGADGRGIEGIQKTGTSGLVDTYTIYYTDNTTSTFQVTNGANGQAGAQGADGVGITSIEKTSTSGLVDTYTITMSNGTTTTFEVTNGQDGHDLGLASIINNLKSDSTEDALSAAMGKELNEQDKVSGSYVEGEAVTYASSGMTFELGDIVDGEEVTATNVCRSTEYFPCFGTMVCTLGLRYPAVVLYDAEMTYIRRIDPTARPTTLDLGDAKYFRLLVKNTSRLNEAKSYGGSYATHKWENELCKDYVLKLLPKSGISYTSHNLYDKDNMYTDAKQVEASTGVVSTVGLSGIATIPVLGGRIYCYDIPLWHRSLTGAQYKADGTYISAIENVRARGGGYKFMVDIECSFIIMNIYPTGVRDYSNSFALQEGEVYDETYTSYKQTMMATISQMPPAFPYNKPSYVLPIKLCVLGDSIATPTQGRWFDKLMTNFNMKSIRTLAIGKARYTHYSDSIETSNPEQNSHENIITNQVNKLIAGIEGGTYGMPDVVLIHGGINDRQDSDTAPDGDTSMYGNTIDTFITNRTIDYTALDYGDSRLCTLAGGIRMAVETLWTYNPNIKVALTTPIYTGGANNWKVQKINKVIKECAAWLSVPVIDLTYESQIYQRGSFWTDSLHPNEVGSILMADCIGHGLQRYFGGVIMDTRKYTVSGSVLSNGTPQANYHILWYSENYTYIDSYTDENGEFTVELPIGNYSALNGSFQERARLDVRGDMSGVVINA